MPVRFNSDDAEITYEVMGDGPPVVLLHPFPANRTFWYGVTDTLASRYRLLLPDLRGQGDSTPGKGAATMEKHARDVLRMCDREGVGKACFAGISIGGYVVMEIWRHARQRAAALLLCNTRALADSDAVRANRANAIANVQQNGVSSFVESMIPRLIGETTRTNRPDIVDRARRIMTTITIPGFIATQQGLAERPDSMPTLQTINVPTLILAGDEERLTPAGEEEAMHRAVKGSQFSRVVQAGHFAIFERPEESGRIIRNFLDGLAIG